MEPNRIEELVTVVGLVREGKASTRGDIAEQMSLRSTTVSELVGDLVAHDLLRESTIKKRGRGRPAAQLTFNPLRLGAIFVSVIDRTLIAKAVDLGCRILYEGSITPPENATNTVMADHLRDLVAGITRCFQPGTDICAVVCSFSGVIDVPKSTWCFTSRWPQLQNLDVAAALAVFGRPVILVRNLDAELAGIRLQENHPAGTSALLLHWGHGIGAAYSTDDIIVNRSRGRFCEIGHWGLGTALGRRCTCGNLDCLETVAALWALGPALRERFPDLPLNESDLAARAHRLDLLESPAMEAALQQVLRLTTNLCRLLFPDRIILTGPFVQNPDIFSRFVHTLKRAPLLQSLDKVRVSVKDTGMDLEIAGALSDPFDAALRALVAEDSEADFQETGMS